MNPVEIEIIKTLQKGLPIASRPFKEIGERLGLSEEVILETVKKMKQEGIIRRFGAMVKHRQLGYSANAMVVWKVPEDQVAHVGMTFASNDGVSHCYERQTNENWKYNLFTMIHGTSKEQCYETAKRMSELSGIMEYRLLFSTRELKKSSMKYFE